jgi:hypothetical protein
VAPESDRPAIIHELIALFDGPAQREAQTLAAEALGDATVALGVPIGTIMSRLAAGRAALAKLKYEGLGNHVHVR